MANLIAQVGGATFETRLYITTKQSKVAEAHDAPWDDVWGGSTRPGARSASEHGMGATSGAGKVGITGRPAGVEAGTGRRAAAQRDYISSRVGGCQPAHLICSLLQGVRRVFVLPGAKIDRIIEVMRTCDELEVVLCRNEQTAAFMAAGTCVQGSDGACRASNATLHLSAMHPAWGSAKSPGEAAPPGERRPTQPNGFTSAAAHPVVPPFLMHPPLLLSAFRPRAAHRAGRCGAGHFGCAPAAVGSNPVGSMNAAGLLQSASFPSYLHALAEHGPLFCLLCLHAAAGPGVTNLTTALLPSCLPSTPFPPAFLTATAGPGVTNLTTALATANCEGDPVVALGGNVPVNQRYKATHQVGKKSGAVGSRWSGGAGLHRACEQLRVRAVTAG